MAQKFDIVREIKREYRRFGTVDTQFTVRLNPPTEPNPNTVDHFLASVAELLKHVFQDMQDSDMYRVAIRNEVNQSDKPIGISFRWRDQISGNVIWSVFEKCRSRIPGSMPSTL
jgi:hypothetical protein